MVSDAANTRIHERTQCVSAEEKILCRPYFRSGHMSVICQYRPSKEEGSIHKKRGTLGSLLLVPLPGRQDSACFVSNKSPFQAETFLLTACRTGFFYTIKTKQRNEAPAVHIHHLSVSARAISRNRCILPDAHRAQDSHAVLRERRQHRLSAERQRRNPAGADRYAGGLRPSRHPVCSSASVRRISPARMQKRAVLHGHESVRYPPAGAGARVRLYGWRIPDGFMSVQDGTLLHARWRYPPYRSRGTYRMP